MFLLDDLLALPFKAPVGGVKWILRQIQTMVDEELMNDTPWKERLVELQMMLEVGDITEEEYVLEEKQVFEALREIRARKEEIARAWAAQQDDEGGTTVDIHTGYGA